jgi:ferredoxin
MSAAITKSADDNTHSGTNPKNKYLVEIDRSVCIGAASCVAIAGATFTLDDKNKVMIVEADWDNDELIMAAAQSCPVFAIKIKDAATGRQIFPEA